MSRVALRGWGRTAPVVTELTTPDNEDEVLAILAQDRPVVARGLGRSYGDAAQVSDGVVVSNRALRSMSPIGEDGVVRVGAGVSIDELLAFAMPQGWFVPVTPGTRQVTMGGAVGADVHGKGHHVDGSFANHVLSMRLATPSGLRVVGPDQDPDVFWATVGAMGLTGIVTEVTMRLRSISSERVLVDTDRFGTLEGVMDEMRRGDDAYNFSVAWVDCMKTGATMGRSILERANFAPGDPSDTLAIRGPRAARLVVPFDAPSGLLNRASIRVFNEAWYRHAPSHEEGAPRLLTNFFHPLDWVRDWNRLYGHRGFVQYQFVVPDDARDVVLEAVERLSSSRVPSFFAVLKRFGPANPGLLSFPMPGWTLALDMPVGPPGLPGVLDELDRLVAAAGGRVYLAKDARLDPQCAITMYPRLDEFRRTKSALDPRGVITSDLARRLELVDQSR